MPRDGTATRTRILDTAERLVIDNGFAATSVDEVIAESGSSKGAFFHHFPTKLDLARALVDRYVAADLAHLDQAADGTRAIASAAERVVAFIRVFEDGADDLMAAQSGCLYVSVVTEQQLALNGTWEQVAGSVVAWRATLAEMLRDALPAGSALDPDALADHLFVTFEGAFILARTMAEPGHMRAQLTVYRVLVEAALASSGR